MKIIVTSDSHGDVRAFKDVVDKHLKDADLVLFLGDGENDFDTVCDLYPHKRFEAVRGNCDFGSSLPTAGSMTVMGKKLLYTHGYLQDVKFGTERLEKWARENGADIVLYGHTHVARSDYSYGLYIVNPGSLNTKHYDPASYAAMEITEKGDILVSIVNIG